MLPSLRPAILVSLTIVLIGCASAPQNTPSKHLSWEQRSAQLQQVNHWRVKGKLALRTSDRSESGSLIWQQAQDDTHITLSGPLGLGATVITSDSRTLRVNRGGTTRQYDIFSGQAAIPDIGWDLPLSSLTYWIKGLPSPHSEVDSETIHEGLWQQLVQDGWTVSLERYGRFQHFTLPTRLTLEREGTRARLILTQWTELLAK